MDIYNSRDALIDIIRSIDMELYTLKDILYKLHYWTSPGNGGDYIILVVHTVNWDTRLDY